jgi:hypothetical protein
MSRRSLLVVLAAAAAAVAFHLRRRRDAARVDVYYEDGSMLSLEPATPQAQRLLALAREALSATRGA